MNKKRFLHLSAGLRRCSPSSCVAVMIFVERRTAYRTCATRMAHTAAAAGAHALSLGVAAPEV